VQDVQDDNTEARTGARFAWGRVMFAKEGLEGVVAARTAISLIKGEEGTLGYRGYSIGELARDSSFEETAYLLWAGELPKSDELAAFDGALRGSRKLSGHLSEAIGRTPRSAEPIDLLRTAVSMMALEDQELSDNSEAADRRKAIRIAAAMPTIVAAYHRLRSGSQPIEPDPALSHAANFLQMLRGKRAEEIEAQAMDTVLVVQADHGLNASTFAARVAAGTLADLHAAATAAIATLKGRLHGGAAREVVETIEAVRSESNADAFVARRLADKKKIAGFGHRVYKHADPRTAPLRQMLERLASHQNAEKWPRLVAAISAAMYKRAGIDPNVDFYSAPIYRLLGIDPSIFASVFACARITGWVAHVIEQHSDNRLIRPVEEYIGPLGRPYVAIGNRE
jgi:citrate synthase